MSQLFAIVFDSPEGARHAAERRRRLPEGSERRLVAPEGERAAAVGEQAAGQLGPSPRAHPRPARECGPGVGRGGRHASAGAVPMYDS